MNAESNNVRRVVIIGGGLVGALNACFFAESGWIVQLYEAREEKTVSDACVKVYDSILLCMRRLTFNVSDIRKVANLPGRSINLALSERGQAALRAIDCEEKVLEHAIPMYGRYLHGQDGKSFNIQKYGLHGEHIFSISRKKLNEILLTTKQVIFKKFSCGVVSLADDSEIHAKADLFCGCDGAFSALRHYFLRIPNFNFSQHYIDQKYIELCIDPDSSGNFKIEPNYFHLWPRRQFCLIGLPNTDKTFTLTLLAPSSLFEAVAQDSIEVDQLFRKNFPDAYDLIGRDNVLKTLRASKPGHFISVKCEPHHADNRLLLLGDAAYAMVPFYGQGMNAGFEDCLILHDILKRCQDNIPLSLEEYSSIRCKDSHAICDLALYNYSELRDLVNRFGFRLRKKIDFAINKALKYRWIPLYNMVTFSRIRYREIIVERKRQDRIVNCVKNFTLGLCCLAVFLLFYTVFKF